MDKLGPPLRTGRDVQRFYDTDTKPDSTVKRPNELLPIKKGATKTRTSTPPSVSRTMSTGALINKRKTSNSDSYSRSDGKIGYDHPSSVNGGNAKGSEGSSPIQLSKFCHECGTRYPVEWAKFCCECGIRRMVV